MSDDARDPLHEWFTRWFTELVSSGFTADQAIKLIVGIIRPDPPGQEVTP